MLILENQLGQARSCSLTTRSNQAYTDTYLSSEPLWVSSLSPFPDGKQIAIRRSRVNDFDQVMFKQLPVNATFLLRPLKPRRRSVMACAKCADGLVSPRRIKLQS
jgi:hypothetical protein